MKDWPTKRLDRKDVYEIPLADDFNSDFEECKNVVLPFMELDESDDKQLVKSIDVISKVMFYRDMGDENQVRLVRYSTTDAFEQYHNGMVLFFMPKYNNTGSTTVELQELGAKPIKHNGAELPAGFLKPTEWYILFYDSVLGYFNITEMSNSNAYHGNPNETYKVADGVSAQDAVNVSQISGKLNKVDVINTLTTDTDKAVSAYQGKIMKGVVDTHNVTMSSNDTNLDTLDAIAVYAKNNKSIIDGLTLDNAPNVKTAVDDKSPIEHMHDDRYFTKPQYDVIADNKAYVHGDANNTFKAKAIPSDSVYANAHTGVTVDQLNSVQVIVRTTYSETTNPTVTINPTIDSATWLNTTTGEIFVCIDKTADANHWMGTNETEIPTPPQSTVNLFNKAIALYELENTLTDTGGVYDGVASDNVMFTTEQDPIGHYCLDLSTVENGGIKITSMDDSGESEPMVQVSFWYNFSMWSTSQNNFVFSYMDSNNTEQKGGFTKDGDTVKFTITSGANLKYDNVDVTDLGVVDNPTGWHNWIVTTNESILTTFKIGNVFVSDTASQGFGFYDQVRTFKQALTSSDRTTLLNER